MDEIKSQYTTKLKSYKPVNEHEKYIIDLITTKLNYIDCHYLAGLTFMLYDVIRNENVSEELKEICKSLLTDIIKECGKHG